MSVRRTYWRTAPHIAVPTDGNLQELTAGDPVVTLDEALFHLRIDAGTEDDYVSALIDVVQQQLVPPNGWLGRALTTTQYRQTLPWFASRIKLAGAPIQSIDAITYLDNDGEEQTVEPSVYRLSDEAIPSIVLEQNEYWPTDYAWRHDAVRIDYTAGYGAPEDVPQIIKQYMLLMITHFYSMRQPVAIGTVAQDIPHLLNMLESWRVRL